MLYRFRQAEVGTEVLSLRKSRVEFRNATITDRATLSSVKPRTLRFGKDKRLTSAAEFVRVREEGKAYRGDLLTIGIAVEEKNSGFRAGFITSRKIGGAVVRNRVRRRLRDIVRKHQRELPSGISIVTIARPAAAGSTYGALEDEWLRLAKRASILARS